MNDINYLSVNQREMVMAYVLLAAMIRQSATRQGFGLCAVFTQRRKERGNMACAALHS